jgi:hypothetical protein
MDQVQDPDAGFISQRLEYLFAKRNVKMFKPHETGLCPKQIYALDS